MRTILTILLLITCQITLMAQESNSNRYVIKSGHIEYDLTGSITGTKSVWWDNYGDKTYTEIKSVTVTKFMGMSSREEEHSINITVGDKYWNVNLLDKTGQKGKLEYYDNAQEFANGLSDAEAKQLEKDILDALGGQRLGSEDYLGYSCELIEVLGAKSWIHKGVVLKSTASILGIESNEIAKSFDKNCKVPSSKFEAPSDIEYTDVSSLSNAYYGEQMSNDDDIYKEDDADDSNTDFVPLTYSYNDFLNAIAPLSQHGYVRAMSDNADGQYVAVFMKGLFFGLTVAASSLDNMDKAIGSYEKFEHNGHNCYYGSDDGSTILAVEFKSEKMMVVFAPTIDQSKEQLLKIVDSCKF